MKRYSLTHLSDECLRRELAATATNEKQATAELLAHIAEFDERKLYLPAGYPSMLAYCMTELRLSEEAAKKRIRVARAGHECPGVFEALGSGRVHLSGLVVLASHLSPQNAADWLAVATHKSREEIEQLVAERFPRLDVPAMVTPLGVGPSSGPEGEGSPGTVGSGGVSGPRDAEGSPGTPPVHAKVSPLSAEAFAVQFTRSREADERFRYTQDLLGHQVAPNDIAEVYDLAMKELVSRLERTRFAATARPGRLRRTAAGSRHIPAHVERAVWQRDEGRCTFVSESGRRCEAKRALEFDHVREFARGGEATVGNIQLDPLSRVPRRGHNQYTAERTYGAGFMRAKRERATEARPLKARVLNEGAGEVRPEDEDVLRALRTLGYRVEESRRALEHCQDMPGGSPEDRLRRALTYFPVRGRRVAPFSELECPAEPAITS